MTISAIVLSKTSDLEHYGLTCRTINSLQSSTGWVHDIIIVESMPESHIKENGFIYPGCEVIYPETEFNYNKFLNIGIASAKADWVLLCNNDLYFYKNWLQEINIVLESDSDVKSICPISPSWHLHQDLKDNYEIGYDVSKHICGWCILANRDMINNCNLFDENFKFWYQDNDYAMTLQKNNIKHCLSKQSRVQHFISKSYNLLGLDEYLMTHGQQQIFVEKWQKNI
jgi:GT2 family glycosyltransferase